MAMMKLSFLLILIAIASLTPRASAKCPCTNPKPTPPAKGGGPILPPIPTVPLPPVPVVTPILPPVPVVTPIKPTPPTKGGGTILPPIPKVPLPPIPTVPLPPVPVITPILPPVPVVTPVLPPIPVVTPILPPVPVITPVHPKPAPKTRPGTGCRPAPPPKKPAKCPIDVVKFGACLDVLGKTTHLGDPKVDCCPLIAGLASAEAAVCLCTTIKLKVLGLKEFMPIAVELLITCGKTPPPGYSCA